MKKTLIIAIVMVTFCVNNVVAQNGAKVSASAKAAFNREFTDASNVRWERVNSEIFLVRFNSNAKKSIAYFDVDGTLLNAGQQISPELVPHVVQDGLKVVLKEHEKKSGALRVIHVYEMIANKVTRYYINLGNKNMYIAVLMENDGSGRIVKQSESGPIQNDPAVAGF